MAQNDYAVVVGINTYPNLGDLEGPRHDALDFYAWLLAADGGNVPKANIERIISPQYAQPPDVVAVQPQLDKVDGAFMKIALALKNSAQQAGRLYLYFAGHGFSKAVGDAALLMANVVRGVNTNQHIGGRAYAEWFSKTSYFREVMLVMDCCREDYKLTPPRPVAFDDISGATPGELLLCFATTWSRASREGPWGANNEVRGIFTLALLAGLRGGAARDANGQVKLAHLISFVHEYVAKSESLLPAGQKAQSPRFTPYDPTYDWKFNPPPGEPACNAPEAVPVDHAKPHDYYVVRIAAANGNAGQSFEVVDANQQVVPVAAQTPQEWTWHVKQGFYKVTRSDGASALFEAGGAKETIDVQL